MYSILHYSATGNTAYLARKLEEKLGTKCAENMNVSTTEISELKKVEHLIIMYSIHAFNPPKEIVEFVKQMPANLFERVSIIGVGCNDIWINEANSLGIKKILQNKGYEIGIERVLAMPLTIVTKFPKDTAYSIIKKSKEEIIKIGNDLLSNVKDNKVIPVKSKVVSYMGRFEKYAVRLFALELYANKDCISCGKCSRECPSKNIYLDKNEIPKFRLNCSMCMKCIYDCPVNAIKPRISKFLPIKDGYDINEYI